MDVLAPIKNRRNREWCYLSVPNRPTEFEVEALKLGLEEPGYLSSIALRRWCEVNRNRVYVPEWLLKEWGITVEAIFAGIA